MLRAGHAPASPSYRAVREAMEASLTGDQAGFRLQDLGDDLGIVHEEGLFLLRKHAP